MASIEETLYAILSDDADLVALVGDKIFPGQIPADEDPPPWVFYTVPESNPVDQLDGDEQTVRHQVEFHALAETYPSAKAIISAIMAALDTYSGGQITRAFWDGSSQDITTDGYHHSCRIDLWSVGANIVALTPSGSRITTGDGIVTITAGGHTLTLDADGLLLDGQPVATGGGGGGTGNIDGGHASSNYGGITPLDGGSA